MSRNLKDDLFAAVWLCSTFLALRSSRCFIASGRAHGATHTEKKPASLRLDEHFRECVISGYQGLRCAQCTCKWNALLPLIPQIITFLSFFWLLLCCRENDVML